MFQGNEFKDVISSRDTPVDFLSSPNWLLYASSTPTSKSCKLARTRNRHSLLAMVYLIPVFLFAGPTFAETKSRLKSLASGQSPVAKNAKKIPWQLSCASVKGKQVCRALYRVTVPKTRRLVLSATVQTIAKSKKTSLLLKLPHGIFLPAGIELTIDKSRVRKEMIQTCDTRGCYAGLEMDRTFTKDMRTGRTMAVSFKSLTKKRLTVQISLSGFDEAYKKIF
ncbi:MAG: invasion associated locus B family protein [Hyphomicrobiaceae bacterium]